MAAAKNPGEGVTAWLSTLDDDALAHLLSQRTDLLVAPPKTLDLLGARISQPHSLAAALAVVDASAVQVAETLAELGSRATVPFLVTALGADERHVRAALDRLSRLGLAWKVNGGAWRCPPALRAASAPESFRAVITDAPFGLQQQAVRLLGLPSVTNRKAAVTRLCEVVESPEQLDALMADAPAGVDQLVTRIAEKGPVPRQMDPPARWLAERCLLLGVGSARMTLPAELLRWHRRGAASAVVAEPPLPVPAGPGCGAEHALRLVGWLRGALLRARPGLKALASGGIGVQEQRRLAKALGLDLTVVVRLLGLAGDTGLLTTGIEAGRLTKAGGEWLALREPEAYVQLLQGFVTAGVSRLRDESPPLSGYGWVHETVPSFRDLLEAATRPADHGALLDWVTWRWSGADRASMSEELAGLELLGLRERGHPAPWLAPLLAGDDPLPALLSALPPVQDDAVFQADGTVVVAGRAGSELADLLGLLAERESERSWRLTTTSIRSALDAGQDAGALITRLHAASRHALPQVLEQLVRDVARLHGQIQVFASATVLRVEDEPLRITLLRDKKLAALGLQEVQPGLLSSVRKPADVLAALRKAGHAPVGPPDKQPSLPSARPAPVRRHHYPDPAEVVRALRSPAPAPQRLASAAWQPNVNWHQVYAPQLTADEAHLLHLAIQDGETSVEIDYVDVNRRQTTRVISELVQLGQQIEAWCELRDDDRVFSLANVLAVRPG